MIANTLPKSLQDNPRLDQWLAILPNGAIQLKIGKIEIGQGIATALAQIAAEELDVDLARLVLLAGDTDQTPDEGTTSSSLSVEMSGASVRLVCAETRALFLAAAAEHLARSTPARPPIALAIVALAIVDGAITDNGAPIGLDYWSLADHVSLARDATGGAAPKPRAAHRVVGASIPRLDLPAKLSGAGFLHDMTLPGLRHARTLHPPRPGAQLDSVDQAAIARAGASLTRHGNFAALLADSEGAATAALAAANPSWSGGRTLSPAMAEATWLVGQPAVHTWYGPAPAARDRISATYTRPYISHGTLGPSVAIAQYDGDHLTIWSHTQGVFPLRRHLATLTGLPEAAISVRHAQGAGCYGHNGADDAAAEAALLATLNPGRPIRLQWTRADEFAHEPAGTAMSVTIEAAIGADGMPMDWITTIWSAPHVARAHFASMLPAQSLPDPPAGPTHQDPPPDGGGGASRNAIPIYDVPNQRLDVHLVQRPPIRTSALRGLGALPNVFAIESFLDELAERAAIDPLEYRLKLLSDPRARNVLTAAAAMADWPARGPGGTGRGLGIGLGRYKNRSAYAAVVVAVEVDTEIRLRHIWCAADGGLVINPDGARNQLEGGIIQAASMTLKEQIRLDADGISSRSWADYPILRFSEIPEISLTLLDPGDAPPLGMGECTMGPTAAAIANAVAHALGTRIRAMPLTRDRIAAALLAP